MLEKLPIYIYFFSGTGNTFLIASKIHETFEKNGYESYLKTIRNKEKAFFPEKCHIGLIFPVAMQSSFPIVWDFIHNLPEGLGRKVFMADSMQIFSGGIVGPMKKVLSSKGFNCIGAKEFKMSNSMVTSQKKFPGEISKNDKAIRESELYALDLINEKTKWKRIPFFSDLMRSFSSDRKIWTSFSKKIKVDNDLCIKCGLCEKICPTSSVKIENKVEIDYSLCISCMRCLNYCPKNAFIFGNKKIIQNKTVKINSVI